MSLTPAEKRLVGGSDVAAIVGVSPYGSAYSVWERIVNGVERGDSAAMSRGRRLEPVVLDWYAEQTGREIYRGPDGKGVRWQTGDPRLRASLDATSRLPGTWEGMWDRVVDAKTAGANEAHRYGEEGTDAIPAEYLCQFHFYMGLTQRARTDVPALVAGDFRMYVVAFDADVYGELREAVDRFWVDHVLTKRPPDPMALPNDVETLQRRFRRHEDVPPLDYATLPESARMALCNYLEAYADEATASERRALWEARAKMAVGGAPGVRGLPEGLGVHRIDWKQNKATARVDWEAVARHAAKVHGVDEAELMEHAKAFTRTVDGARPFVPRARRVR